MEARMTVSEILNGLPQENQSKLPVIFHGSQRRLIGFASSIYEADALAIPNHVSATFCSLAEFGGRRFFVLHG
jgi:hypothetical protein